MPLGELSEPSVLPMPKDVRDTTQQVHAAFGVWQMDEKIGDFLQVATKSLHQKSLVGKQMAYRYLKEISQKEPLPENILDQLRLLSSLPISHPPNRTEYSRLFQSIVETAGSVTGVTSPVP